MPPDHTRQNSQSSSPKVASNATLCISNFDQKMRPTILNHVQLPVPPLQLARREHPNSGAAQCYNCATAKSGCIASPRPSFRYRRREEC
uniref:Uncharacterized protein n=1 Tax=Romanomermis culicivorax TaxID=13658 RepID=A0A915KGZ8_ROMCU